MNLLEQTRREDSSTEGSALRSSSRFATELILRRGSTTNAIIAIMPRK